MSDITPLLLRNSILTAFDTFWAQRTPIAVPNVAFDPDKVDGDAWARVTITGRPEGEARHSHSVARTALSREGDLTIQVSVRSGTDLDLAYALTDAVIEWMGKPSLATAYFTKVGTPIELGDTGAWFQVSVSATWLYFTDKAA